MKLDRITIVVHKQSPTTMINLRLKRSPEIILVHYVMEDRLPRYPTIGEMTMYEMRNTILRRAACLLFMSKAVRTALRTLMIVYRSM